MSQVSVLNLVSPIRVAIVDCYGWGTVWWFRFDDANQNCATLCLDAREGSPTRFRLFDGARHPGRKDAVLLPLGGPEEGIIVPLLSHWVDSDQFRKMPEYGQELFQFAFNRYGEPQFAGDS